MNVLFSPSAFLALAVISSNWVFSSSFSLMTNSNALFFSSNSSVKWEHSSLQHVHLFQSFARSLVISTFHLSKYRKMKKHTVVVGKKKKTLLLWAHSAHPRLWLLSVELKLLKLWIRPLPPQAVQIIELELCNNVEVRLQDFLPSLSILSPSSNTNSITPRRTNKKGIKYKRGNFIKVVRTR